MQPCSDIQLTFGTEYSMAFMVADELLSIRANNVEMMHQLSRMAEQKELEVLTLERFAFMEIIKKERGGVENDRKPFFS